MKGIYLTINFDDFLSSLEKICMRDKKLKIIQTILTWGDYYEELCKDDGGIIQEHFEFFKNKPLGRKIYSYTELENILHLAHKIPFLSSKNGNYKLYYDVHIWINRYYFCYNIFLNRCYCRYQNILQYIFGVSCFPEWQN